MSSLGSLAITRVNAPAKPTATVIFLHGLGDSGEGWSFLPAELYKNAHLQHINFVLPAAPTRKVTAFGERIPAWFDVYSFDGSKGSDNDGIRAALQSVKELVNKEIEKGTPPDRIVLGGFSQGAALTQGMSIVCEHKLAGFMSVSGFFPKSRQLAADATGANLETPLLMLHGTADQVVPFVMGQKSRDALKADGFGMRGIEWREYEGLAHSINLEGLDHIVKFLERVLPAK